MPHKMWIDLKALLPKALGLILSTANTGHYPKLACKVVVVCIVEENCDDRVVLIIVLEVVLLEGPESRLTIAAIDIDNCNSKPVSFPP